MSLGGSLASRVVSVVGQFLSRYGQGSAICCAVLRQCSKRYARKKSATITMTQGLFAGNAMTLAHRLYLRD
jgi:predicted MFS family arabinose efflux permease